MKKYTFLVFHRDYEHFLEQLREAGVLHVAEKATGIADNDSLQQQIQLTGRIRKTISSAEQYLPEGSAPVNTGNAPADTEALIAELPQIIAEKQQLAEFLNAVQKEQKRMQVWGNFSVDKLKALQAEGYDLQYYVCPKNKFNAEWETEYNAFVVAEDGGLIYFVTINKPAVQEQIDAEQVQLNSHNAQQLEADAEGLKGLIAAKQAQLEAWAIAHTGELEEAERQNNQSIDWKRVALSTTQLADDTLCLLEGFCPIDGTEELDKMLDQEHIFYTSEDPTEEDNTPVKLRNNWFTRMFECLTGMYGWPVYGEFDPTPILAPFFLLFFALCMGDAGYGILLIIFGILTARKVINIEMFEGLGPLITTLGIGTLVVGFFLGTFFGIDLYTASWVPDSLKSVMIKGDVAGFDIQMVMALCIGVFHICLAMIIKAICYTKRFGFKQNISTWGWLLLILGALATGIFALTDVFSPEVTKWVLIAVGSVSALGIYIFNTPGRNPLINIGAGLWDTYNMATGILGDVLSYIRLYALGLAGGMLGAAFNSLGLMVLGENPNVGTWLGFIAILIVGHLLNLCMSALGAFVHPLRLSFVEYFKNSGYEGKGHLYKPFAK
ncbi:MAG: ATPase V [Paludibacteraceae bacterium]|nr:ATPase V [Paludibacteraceae bacterium]